MAQNWNPINDLLFLQERMNRLFEDATQRRSGTEEDDIRRDQEIERADWVPAADVTEREGDYVISLDLPGIDRQSLDISVEKDRLLIRGTRTLDGENRRRSERPQGRFFRKFGLPGQVDQSSISADYQDGVLRITIPKRPEPQAKRVEIKVS
jgi:HSP20 family protein